ncbi:hypothetical protein H4684_003707 [Desulfomicrobium macestii]|uniref:Uncharacterized protein n=1 Tax=Desulfomicrobium macestii TaxID=90731 RepID=A0ABR9H8K1_9BACT|nr:hypothetical protein [Desulfomicrobium macestii]
MQIHKFINAVTSGKAFEYLQLAITTASVCIAIMCMGVIYVNYMAG